MVENLLSVEKPLSADLSNIQRWVEDNFPWSVVVIVVGVGLLVLCCVSMKRALFDDEEEYTTVRSSSRSRTRKYD